MKGRTSRTSRGCGLGLQWKLTLFMGGVTLATLLMVWLMTTFWLQPRYQNTIRNKLENKADQIMAMIDENGGPIASRNFGVLLYDEAFWSRLGQAFNEGQINVDNCCVDISDATYRCLHFYESMYPCLIHGSSGAFSGDFDYSQNSKVALQLRHTLLQEGALDNIINMGSNSQMVVGRVSKDGQYMVIVSTSLAQISTAAGVLAGMLPPIALILLLLNLLVGAMFSRWFTRPIQQLSHGAREIAAGNYTVRVAVRRNDEVGLLAQEFNHMADEVQRSAQLEKDLLANVSHDLRTPLTLIKGYAETVRDITGNDEQRRTEQCNIIVDETDRLSALVNSVMELSKVSSGAEPPNRVRFDMSELCFEVAGRYDALCDQNGWTLRLEADAACPVYADPAMMERVLHNLLGNASHHLGEDGVFVLRAIPKNGGCRVEVEDHGPGIPPEDLPHLFDRYYRSRKDAGKTGTGLGLSITKAILQQHGFAFGVDSAVGHGSTFWFEMPCPPENRA